MGVEIRLMSEHEPRRITRRTALKWGALAAAAPAFRGVPLDVLAAQDGVVLLWNEAALQGVRDSRLGPPMVARALAIVQTSVFDAWAAYDHRSVGTRLGGALRRPPPERTLANINTAISFAAYRAAVDLFPGDRASVFDPLMRRLGLDPANATTDLSSPEGVGNVAAQAVLEYRHHDGANQLGDEPGGNPGVAYADYTGYVPVNDPMDLRPGSHFDAATVHDPNRWQPLRYFDATGAVVTQSFVGAQWQHVAPFALTSVAQLRSSTGPARYPAPAYDSQARALLDLSAGLTDKQKMIAEYWADGPRSELPPGHWNVLAQFVSRRDHHGAHRHGVAADAKLFFGLTNAIFDASICCWDNKLAFDSVRPITAIRYAFNGPADPCLGWPISRHPADGRHGVAAISSLHLPDAALRGVQLGPQHVQRVRGGNPETLHGKRSVRRVGHLFSGQLEVRSGSRAFQRPDAAMAELQRCREPGRALPPLRRDPLRAG